MGSVAGLGVRVENPREQETRLAGLKYVLPATISPISRIPRLH